MVPPGSSSESARGTSSPSTSASWVPTRVLVVTDPGVAATGAPDEIAETLRADGVEPILFDRARVEPTDASMIEAIEFARSEGPFDAIVAIGGGSSIDTAKAVNLLVTNDGDLMDYVNAPVGRGQAPTNPLLPLVAVPTTTGTGSESTTICVLDVLAQHVKTGISHPRLRPTLAVVDPELTSPNRPESRPPRASTSCATRWRATPRDPFASYEHKNADERVPYCGSNPIADLWSEQALVLMSGAFRTAVHDGKDLDARTQVAMAATFAGLGFGNAGVHIPHANAYPIAGQVRDFRPEGYDADHAMVPHGMAVALTAPAAFGFTFEAAPERHVRAAELLSQGSTDSWAERPDDPADHLPRVLTGLMREVGIPSGLAEVGYGAGDIDALVEGTMKQQRLLATAPREVTEDDVAGILDQSIELW